MAIVAERVGNGNVNEEGVYEESENLTQEDRSIILPPAARSAGGFFMTGWFLSGVSQ